MPVSILGLCFVLQPWRKKFKPTLTAVIFGYVTSSISGIPMTTGMLIVYYYPFLHKQCNQVKTLFWNCAVGTIVSLLGALALEDFNFQLLSWTDCIFVLGHCGTFTCLLLLQMYVSSVIPGVIFTLIGTTSVMYSLIAQYTFLSGIQPGNHNWMEILGIVFIIFSVSFPSVIKVMKQKHKEQDNT